MSDDSFREMLIKNYLKMEFKLNEDIHIKCIIGRFVIKYDWAKKNPVLCQDLIDQIAELCRNSETDE